MDENDLVRHARQSWRDIGHGSSSSMNSGSMSLAPEQMRKAQETMQVHERMHLEAHRDPAATGTEEG